jgi:RimJ/RimL family protein N-acetyltransferase
MDLEKGDSVISELENQDYGRVRTLYGEWHSRLVTVAVLEGRCPGRVYVDDVRNPRSALLWDHVEGELYLAGAADNPAFNRAINTLIRNQIRTEAQESLPDLSECTLVGQRAWQEQIEILLEGTNPMRHCRKRFALKHARVDWRMLLPDGFEMMPLDAALFEQDDLEGVETMRDWVLGDCRTAAEFERDERGCCVIHRPASALVAWCASEYTCRPVPGGERACELGIYTRETYRRQGFATLVAAATVERCQDEGIGQIGWHCWDSNLGSAATARKVGFELVDAQPVWNACFNKFDNWLLQAHYCNQAGQTEEALSRWERAFEMWESKHPDAVASPHLRAHPDTIPWCYYAAARARAGLGDTDAALRLLNRALDEGWENADHLRRDETLAGLRGLAGWEALMARLLA